MYSAVKRNKYCAYSDNCGDEIHYYNENNKINYFIHNTLVIPNIILLPQ